MLEAAFWDGVEQFNHRQFYECHDTLEAIWMEAMEPDRTFYQGVLQIAVALYHLSNGNGRGATMLLGEGLRRLGRYTPDYGGVDVEQLVHQSAAILEDLQQRGPEQATELWRSLSTSPDCEAPCLPTIHPVR
ncbi:DUF309 domain-containing protein [Thermoleptolyngbya sp. C42_A2020_037]|uniref:DUF309 domain-containing protein n=1 Tax=Thermoleptolyngbya sp. C42_A2020_037 TaxID=2747799 RepID=UPI0019F03A63|nr:DUF309 domain-containing protein [Thermoleptolyngbya sp. C42_A2020_037]MBF2084214.1 DUF309 domain-containing protein [Thermoleptolyngbya sp. C42_A2020_037]